MRHAAARPASGAGFTLLEMLIVVVLFGLVLGGLMTVIRRQQAFYRSAGEMMEVRSQADQAFGILARDLRTISSVGGDIFAMTDTSITFRSQLGSSVMCFKSTDRVVVPPVDRLLKRHRLTVWREEPVVGDEVLVFDEGALTNETDDTWRTHSVTGKFSEINGTAGACPAATGFVTAADTGKSWRFTVSPNLSSTIVQGAPIRFGRKAKYALYQAADAQWYVGYQDSTGSGWSARAPVSGPYRSYSATAGASGLNFVYVDAAGNILDPSVAGNRALVSRIDLTIRGITRNVVDIAGKEREQFVDSLAVSVDIRNRQ